MLKAIAEFQIIEKIDGKTYPTKMNIFREKDKIKVIRISGDRRVTTFEGTAKTFLYKIGWAHTFLDSKKLEQNYIKEYKNWRK